MDAVGPTADTEADDGWDASEGVLPEQWTDVAARYAHDPCRLLWLAVFAQAIISLDRGARDMYRTWSWVASESEDVCSFLFICDVLDLEAEVWRRALLAMARRPRGRPKKRARGADVTAVAG